MISQSASKIEVVYQPAPGKPYKESTITVKGQRLQVVDKFTYLGSILSRVVHIDDEVNARIAKAIAAFGRLRGSIWDQSGIRLDSPELLQILMTLTTVIKPLLPNFLGRAIVILNFVRRFRNFIAETVLVRKM